MIKSGVYKIVNTVNGKVYVGSSKNLKKRETTHFRRLRKGIHVNPKLQNSYNAHGRDSFEFSVIEECPHEKALRIEQHLLDIYVGHEKCFNISKNVSAPMAGKTHSEETKKKMSESRMGREAWNKGIACPEETKEKISKTLSGEGNPNYGKTLSEKRRREISEFAKTRVGELNPMYGKSHSDETKAKLSEANKGKVGYWLGKNLSEETKRKISEARKGMTHSEQAKRKMSESRTGLTHSDETRRKMSEAHRGVPKKKVECPHCNKIGGASNMKRYHFNNCKLKEN